MITGPLTEKHLFERPQKGFALVTVLLMVSLLALLAVTVTRVGGLEHVMTYNHDSGDQAYYTAVAGAEHAIFILKSVDSEFTGTLTDIPFGSGTYTLSIAAAASPRGSTLVTSAGRNRGAVRRADAWQGDPGGGCESPILIHPAIIKDTFSEQNKPDEDHGDETKMNVGAGSVNSGVRGLVEFDLSGIPPGAFIVSAQLELYLNGNSGAPSGTEIEIEAHRITRSWDEGTGSSDGATWQSYDSVSPWDNLGGDFDSTVEAVTTVGQNSKIWIPWDITTLFQYWVDNPSENYGMMLKDSDEGTDSGSETFASTFNTMDNNNRKPILTVEYCD